MNRLFYALFCLLCIVILLQDFIGITLFNLGIPKYLLQIFLSLKDIILFLIISLNLMTYAMSARKIQFNPTLFFFGGYALIVAVYFFYFGEINDIFKNINDLRSLIFPIYAYIAGYTSFYLKREQLVKFIEKAVLFSVLLSLITYLLGDSFLLRLKVLAYTENIRGYYGLIFKGLPSAFFINLKGSTIFRLAGPILNPTGTAILFIFVFGIVLAYYRFVKKEMLGKLLLILLTLATFLTFTRGPIIGLILAIIFTDIIWSKDEKSKKPLYMIYIAILFLSIIFYDKFSAIIKETVSLEDPSAKSHYNALVVSWEYLKSNWFGRGIGSIGMWQLANFAVGVGENSFIFIIGQVGIIAFIFLTGAYLNILKNVIKNKGDYMNYGLSICLITLLFTSIFSPSLLTVTPLLLFWFFVGYSEGLFVQGKY